MKTEGFQSGANDGQEDSRKKSDNLVILCFYKAHTDAIFANLNKSNLDIAFWIYEENILSSALSIHDVWPHAKITRMLYNLVNVLSKSHSRIFQELEKPSPKDEGQNRTLDMAEDIEVIKIDPGCLDSE